MSFDSPKDSSKDSSKDSPKCSLSNCNLCLFSTKKCICQPFWKDFHDDFSEVINSKCGATPLRISTITANFKIKDALIDLSKLASQFKRSLFMRSIKFKENSKKSKRNLELNYNFYNQCSITSFIPRENHPRQLVKVSIKVFHNGSFNITGCRSIRGIVHVIRNIVSVLLSYDNVLIIKNEMKIHSANISMINTDFCLENGIKQKLLNNILQNLPKEILGNGFVKRSEFEPDEYHGVKIKFVTNYSKLGHEDTFKLTRKGIEKLPGELTISVFNTGSVIITGGKTSKDTMDAYKFINRVFDTYKEQISKPIIDKIKKKKKLYYKDDEIYSMNIDIENDLIACSNIDHINKMHKVLRDIRIFNHSKQLKKCLDEIINGV